MNGSLLTPTTSGLSPTPERLRTSQQSRNPVAARLYKVLNTKFNDEETGLALQTLSELYATTSPAKELPSGRNVIEDIEEQIHGQDNSASPLFENVPGESAARARKDMRKDMEKKLAEGSRQFLVTLGEVDAVSAIFLPRFSQYNLVY